MPKNTIEAYERMILSIDRSQHITEHEFGIFEVKSVFFAVSFLLIVPFEHRLLPSFSWSTWV